MLENYAPNEFVKYPSIDKLETNLLPRMRKRIMVVDDDLDFRLLICELLVNQGYLVTTAKDGEVALNNLIHQKDYPDIILVDLMMPVKSGIEFRREQLQIEEINEIPVVFITGQGIVDGEYCLLKPFDDRELLDRIKNLLDQ